PENFTSFFRDTIDGCWVTDAAGNFLEVNAAFCGLSGYSRDELRLMNIIDLDATPSREEIWGLVQGAKPNTAGRIEGSYRPKEGERINVEMSVNFVEDKFMFGTVRDITRRKKVEGDLENINKELREAQFAMSDLIGDARDLAKQLAEEKKSVEHKVAER